MKKTIAILVFVALCIAGLVISQNFSFFFPKKITKPSITKPSITIDSHTFTLLSAHTLPEKVKGLSGKDSLPQDSGMLFFFDQPDYYGFWMKDMKFSLDFIYMHNNKIVTIVNDIPKPVSNLNLPIFKPVEPAEKVLEINGGLSRQFNFKVGDNVEISL